jgi:magnesium chelatase family protein
LEIKKLEKRPSCVKAVPHGCPCGYFSDSSRQCKCSPREIQNYLSKISGPLLDRIDIHIEVPAIKYRQMRSKKESKSSAEIRKEIEMARRIQAERLKGMKIIANSQMTSKMIRKFCAIDEESEMLLGQAMKDIGLSARAHDRILKVSRTIADLDGKENIESTHLMEAIQYRSLDRAYWA